MDRNPRVRNRTASFRIEIPGDDEKKSVLLGKMQLMRTLLFNKFKRPVNNNDILSEALDFWLLKHQPNVEDTSSPASFVEAKVENTKQNAFITAESSVQNIVDNVQNHANNCASEIKLKKLIYRGHVAIVTLNCGAGDNPHILKWSSSPYMPNKEYLINHRIVHGFTCSGMLPIHYKRFCKGTQIGFISKRRRNKIETNYPPHVTNVYNGSVEQALCEEIGSYEEVDGIDIMTDARHGWRKNAKDTSVVAIGENTHKVLQCVHITKTDDIVSQRHEAKGTEKIYQYFTDKDVSVKVHTHDRNMSVNKMVRCSQFTVNQNDSWHGVKSIQKAMKSISSGPKYKEGQTWSMQLSDKEEPIATHFHWAIRNCDGDPALLQSRLSNISSHYRNEHSACASSSRCKQDPNYEPSRIVVTNPKADKLLRNAIEGSVIYKSPHDYVLARDTSYVESFNNVMNIFQDKRIAFSNTQYMIRSHLAVLHWNENVDRAYTSVWNQRDQRAPRRQRGKKNYKDPTYCYRDSIWDSYIKSMFNYRRRGRRKQNE